MLARPAAIKMIQPTVLAGSAREYEEALTRFEHEAQVTATLQSPHSVEVYDFGVDDDGVPFPDGFGCVLVPLLGALGGLARGDLAGINALLYAWSGHRFRYVSEAEVLQALHYQGRFRWQMNAQPAW